MSEEVDISPEKLKEVTEKSAPQLLQLVLKNRKESAATLSSKVESLHLDLEKVRDVLGQEPLAVFKNEQGDVALSLESVLRDISVALGSILTGVEASNSLVDMLIHDLGGTVENIKQTQQAIMISNSHTQTLLELLKRKNITTEEEIKECWEELIAQRKAEMEKEA